VVQLAAGQDYVLDLNHRRNPDMGGLSIIGGRNVVIVGGEIEVLGMPDAESARRDALVFTDQTGVVHLEGVRVHGQPLRCLVFNSDQAIFQIENVRCDGIYMWQEDFSTAHSDSVITWKSPRALRFDKYTTDYDNTGVALYGSNTGTFPAKANLKRVNFRNAPRFRGAGPYIYRSSLNTRLTLDRVYAETGWGRASSGPWPMIGHVRSTLWQAFGGPDGGSRPIVRTVRGGVSPGSYIEFVAPRVDNIHGAKGSVGRVSFGVPPGGDFVPRGVAGTGYRTPGYVGMLR